MYLGARCKHHWMQPLYFFLVNAFVGLCVKKVSEDEPCETNVSAALFNDI
jgi:hypothetical protein